MVLHQWGRIDQWVQEQWVCHDDADAADKDYHKTLAAKLKEGYSPSDWGVMPTNYRKYGRPSKKQVTQLPLFEGDL